LRASFLGTAASLLVACFGANGSGTADDPPPANRAPTLSVASSFEVLVGRVLTITRRASDPDGDALTFSVSNRPAWLSFSARTGVLTGTPGTGDVGVYDPVITVSDGKAQATDQARVTVAQAVAGRATLSWRAPTQRVDGSPLTNLAGFRVYYGNSSNDLRYVIQVADPGARSRVIEDLTVGNWFFAATAYDDGGGESSRSSVASKTIV
jgi:hypothetical protein